MNFDARTRAYFNNKVKQVFVYLTNRCQLRCRQCLYKPLLCNESADVDFYMLVDLLKEFYNYGAYKISFLGGEPTLYKDKVNDKDFCDVIEEARKIGYKYIRVDTNGQFQNAYLDEPQIKLLDEITFSLDGHDEKTNDAVRGMGTYNRCVNNIQYAVRKGYKVQITSCVHKYSCPDEYKGLENLKEMISFAESLGVDSINFHPILKVGIARDTWIEDTDIMPNTWINIYEELIGSIIEEKYKIKVRIPMRFCKKENAILDRERYFYCPLEMGERALIMPNGQIKVCAFTIGTDNCVARYDFEGVCFESENNETTQIGTLDKGLVCYNQKTNSESLLPLCMSYKPYQSELVWEDIKNG
ncbi:MAG: radical SAM protein [Eubacteriales bacterium]|nr:radical SAM protein [Eubacteriales bacterium]